MGALVIREWKLWRGKEEVRTPGPLRLMRRTFRRDDGMFVPRLLLERMMVEDIDDDDDDDDEGEAVGEEEDDESEGQGQGSGRLE